MRYWEINGNLADKKDGIKNYNMFARAISITKCYFDTVFGVDCLNKVPFSVDNATDDSGYTPINTVILDKVVVIKLGIKPDDDEAKVVYQFAHELTHVVFKAYFGINKPYAGEDEEMICTAAALTVVKNIYPNELYKFIKTASASDNIGYQNGVPLADAISYDMEKIKDLILWFPMKSQ